MKIEEVKKFITGVDKSNITERMLAVPSHFFDINLELETVLDKKATLEAKLEILKSKAYRDISLTYKNVKTMTPTAINHHITCKEEVIALNNELLILNKKIGILKVKIKTINIFSDKLTDAGNNFRAERSNIKKGV